MEKIENTNHIELINYQKAYSKSNGRILGLEAAIRDERNR